MLSSTVASVVNVSWAAVVGSAAGSSPVFRYDVSCVGGNVTGPVVAEMAVGVPWNDSTPRVVSSAISGVVGGSRVCCFVRAVSGQGGSDWSQSSLQTCAYVYIAPPGPPANVSVTGVTASESSGATAVYTLLWQPSSFTGATGVSVMYVPPECVGLLVFFGPCC